MDKQLLEMEQIIKNQDATIAALREQNAKMLAMLERLEMSQTQDCGAKCCPECYMSKHQGHMSNCSLGKLLAEMKEKK
jgi:hypothetical protein